MLKIRDTETEQEERGEGEGGKRCKKKRRRNIIKLNVKCYTKTLSTHRSIDFFFVFTIILFLPFFFKINNWFFVCFAIYAATTRHFYPLFYPFKIVWCVQLEKKVFFFFLCLFLFSFSYISFDCKSNSSN